jgi:hypothetical protein
MIRERRLGSVTFGGAGATNSFDISRDAVFHQIQLECDGNISLSYPTGTTPVATQFAEGFPFNMIARVQLIRNGSDVVWSGSGKQLSKESLILNGTFPFARLWVDQTNNGTGTAGALLTKSVRGITIPSNSEGIGCNNAVFTDATPNSGSGTVNQIDFRFLLEMWLQLPVDKYFTTLVDARPLATFQLQILWEQNANFMILGSTTGGTATPTVTLNCSVQSYDQDNLKQGLAFGTFKRSNMSPPGLSFGGTNQQFLLPKGNLYYGILFETLGLKAAGLVTIPEPGNDILTEIVNRVNTNYYLRDVFYRDLQAKNRNDGALPSSPYDTLGAGVLGWAALKYPVTGDKLKELVQTFSYDNFDLLLNLGALSGGQDGNTYNGTPVVNILTQEVIPGRSVAAGSPRGAFAGSIAATSAKNGQ